MSKFHSLRVADIRKETGDCVSVAFEIPATLEKEFRFIAGQYITVRLYIDGEELRRSYSICTSPATEREFRIAAKLVKEGKVSGYFNNRLKAGDYMDVMPPSGNFHSPIYPTNKKMYVLVAGGSGITPIISILKTVLHTEPGSNTLLLYANRNKASIIFNKQIEQLSVTYAGRLTVHHIMEQWETPADELFTGMLTLEKAESLIRKYVNISSDNEYFICGPAPMMKNVKDALEAAGAAKERIHIEYFTAALDDVAKAEHIPTPSHRPVCTSKVTVVMDGIETVINLSSNGAAILDAALNAGVDVPFSCKGAVCCTCKAKLIKGKVEMDMNYALSDREVEQGYILTCQSHPVTAEVTVNYDER